MVFRKYASWVARAPFSSQVVVACTTTALADYLVQKTSKPESKPNLSRVAGFGLFGALYLGEKCAIKERSDDSTPTNALPQGEIPCLRLGATAEELPFGLRVHGPNVMDNSSFGNSLHSLTSLPLSCRRRRPARHLCKYVLEVVWQRDAGSVWRYVVAR